jgi:hypothetical protein
MCALGDANTKHSQTRWHQKSRNRNYRESHFGLEDPVISTRREHAKDVVEIATAKGGEYVSNTGRDECESLLTD